MRNTIFAIIIGTFLFCGSASAQGGTKEDETAIAGTLQQMGTAFETGDMTVIDKLMTENVTHVDPFGSVTTGRTEVKKLMQWVRDVPYGGKKLTSTVSEYSISFLNSDSAIVIMRFDSKGDGVDVRERVTATLVRVGSQWQVAHFQPVLITQAPSKAK